MEVPSPGTCRHGSTFISHRERPDGGPSFPNPLGCVEGNPRPPLSVVRKPDSVYLQGTQEGKRTDSVLNGHRLHTGHLNRDPFGRRPRVPRTRSVRRRENGPKGRTREEGPEKLETIYSGKEEVRNGVKVKKEKVEAQDSLFPPGSVEGPGYGRGTGSSRIYKFPFYQKVFPLQVRR